MIVKQFQRIAAVVLAALMTVLLLAGCGGSGGAGGKEGSYPVEVGGVSVSAKPAGIAVLSDNLADIVIALRYEGQMTGKSESCTQSELDLLPNLSIDDPGGIKGSGADVVLLDAEPNEAQRLALEEQELQVIVLPAATNRESFMRLYEQIGALFQGSGVGDERGKKLANSTLMLLDDIERSIPARSVTPTGCYLYDLNGHAVTGDTFAGMLFSYAGVQNVFASSVSNSTEGASITAGNPMYIFCAPGLKDQILKDRRYRYLSAVKNNRVYELDPTLITRQGDTIVEGISEIAGTVYPELLDDAMSDENDSAILEDEPASETSSKASSKTTSSKAASSKTTSSKATSSKTTSSKSTSSKTTSSKATSSKTTSSKTTSSKTTSSETASSKKTSSKDTSSTKSIPATAAG